MFIIHFFHSDLLSKIMFKEENNQKQEIRELTNRKNPVDLCIVEEINLNKVTLSSLINEFFYFNITKYRVVFIIELQSCVNKLAYILFTHYLNSKSCN